MGSLLVLIPVLNFFALGYVYALVERGRRGEVLALPDWEEWRTLFLNGLAFFVILAAWCLIPILAGWLVSLPVAGTVGPFARLAMIPGLVLGVPLTAAGVYRYQRRDSFRDALRLPVLWAMMEATKLRLVVPTLAFLGLVWVGKPVLPFALFTGGVAVFSFYACFFRYLEDSRRGSVRPE